MESGGIIDMEEGPRIEGGKDKIRFALDFKIFNLGKGLVRINPQSNGSCPSQQNDYENCPHRAGQIEAIL